MTNLYRLTPIEGKGFGIVASTFIKKGTVILEEKAQMPFLDDGPDLQEIRAESWMNWIKKIMALYSKMKKSDQEEYLELYNQFENDPKKDNSLWMHVLGTDQSSYENSFKEYLLMFIQRMEDDKEKVEKTFKIVGIYFSNSVLKDGLKIKRSRFNHSCRANTFDDSDKIWATSNIEPGQEITVNYAKPKAFFNMLSKGTRHFYLRVNFNVTNCFCDFCKEDTNNETVMGSKIDNLLGELEILGNDFGSIKEALFSLFPFSADSNYEELTTDCYTPEKGRRLVDLCKELYKLGKERKDQTTTLYTMLNLGYMAAEMGILMVWKGPKKQMAEGFKNDCISFCKAIETFGKLLGKQLVKPEKWRKLHQDYDKHLEIFGVKLS